MKMLAVDGLQLLIAFSDDIDKLAKSTTAVKEQFVEFKQKTNKMGLIVNDNKTKHIRVTRQPHIRFGIGQNFSIGNINSERISSFKYL